MARVIYFSSVSNNTHRFVQRLGTGARRIPLRPSEPFLHVGTGEYILITPTYGHGTRCGAVPKQVIKFLNDEHNRSLCRGVVAAGNTNFGAGFCIAGDIIARKLGVPHLHRFELLGTPSDIEAVTAALEKVLDHQHV